MTLTDYKVKFVPPDMTEEAFLQVLREGGSPVTAHEARAIYSYCVARQLSPAFLLGMFRKESSFGKYGSAAETHSLGNTRPPSFGVPHIGVTDRNFSRYATWTDGGVSTVARFFDHAPYQGKDTVATIIPVWAPPSENDTAKYVADVLADIARYASPAGSGTTGGMNVPKIALASGHHNSSGGDAFEVQQTGPLCKAVAEHCRALGMDARVVQPGDGLGTIAGSLDVVGNTVVKWAQQDGWVPDIFLECHTEGGGGAGCFAIYPDWGGDVDADVRDRLGPDVARAVATLTGLGVRGDGTMSEQATGVGASGSRLGIFRTTAPIAASTTRLIIEYGAHDKEPDLSIAKGANFADRCGRATAGAFAAFLGWQAPQQPATVESPVLRALRALWAA